MRRRRRVAARLITMLVMTGTSVTHSAADPPAGIAASIAPNTVRNPIREHAPDPSLVYDQGSYYLTYTAGSRIVITKASSLTEIQQAPEIVVWDDDTPSRCCNMWAPELHLLRGQWYIYYSADDITTSGSREDMEISHHRMYVLESAGSGGTDPMGPYIFKGELDTAIDGAAIDGTVWEQPDQSLYFIWSGTSDTSAEMMLDPASRSSGTTLDPASRSSGTTLDPASRSSGTTLDPASRSSGTTLDPASRSSEKQNIYIAPMSDPWTISGQPVLISQPEYEWEALHRRRHRDPGTVNEAPTILRHDGKIFLTYSAGGCGNYDYTLGMLTLTDDSDPLEATSWVKKPNPVFTYSADHWVWAPGSNGFFSSPDGSETWLVYHALSSSDGAPVGECSDNRSTRVQKVSFDADGTPNFGEPMASWQSMPLPKGDPGTRVVPNGRYLITATAGGKSLEKKGCVTAHDESPHNVDVWEYRGARCQQWDLEYLGDGSYRLAEVGSDRALEVSDCREDDSAPVTVHRYRGDDCQKWYLDRLGDDVYRISSRASGKSLNVSDCSQDNGSAVNIWPYWSDVNSALQCQRWRLRKIG